MSNFNDRLRVILEAYELDYTNIPQDIKMKLSQYKSHEQQWALQEYKNGEDINSIIDGLEYYNNKIKDNRYRQILSEIIKGVNPKDLVKLTLRQIKSAQQQYEYRYSGQSKRKTKKIAKETRHEYTSVLVDESDLKIIKIEKTDNTNGAAEAAREIARGTDWCVSNIEQANVYLDMGPLYYIRDRDRSFLCHIESSQFKDMSDHEYKLSIREYRMLSDFIPRIGIFLRNTKSPEYKRDAKYSPEKAAEYAWRVIGDRWPEAEPYIMQDPYYALEYAIHVIKGRWPEAENIMLDDNYVAREYSRFVKDIISEDEYYKQIICKSPHLAYSMAISISRRITEAEPYIMRDPEIAYHYANNIIDDRWPEAEPIIMRHPEWACRYARDVVGHRWPEAEPYIMREPYFASRYARYVMFERWPEAEHYIMSNREAYDLYYNAFYDEGAPPYRSSTRNS